MTTKGESPRFTRKTLIAAAEAHPNILVRYGPGYIDINRGAKGKGVGVRLWEAAINRNDTRLDLCKAMTVNQAAHLLGLDR